MGNFEATEAWCQTLRRGDLEIFGWLAGEEKRIRMDAGLKSGRRKEKEIRILEFYHLLITAKKKGHTKTTAEGTSEVKLCINNMANQLLKRYK